MGFSFRHASYQIWRNTSADFSTVSWLAGGLTSLTYDDTSALAGVTYYYWVRGRQPEPR